MDRIDCMRNGLGGEETEFPLGIYQEFEMLIINQMGKVK